MPWRYMPNPNTTAGPNVPAMVWVRVDAFGNPISYEDPGCAALLVTAAGMVLFAPWGYPVTLAILSAVWWVSSEIADARFRGLNSPALLAITLVPTVIAFWICMRLEQRLGQYAIYRWPRYALRLLLPAFVVNVMAREELGLVPDPDPDVYVRETFQNGSLLTATLVGMAVFAVILWAGSWVRDSWHYGLRVLRLRSAKLDD